MITVIVPTFNTNSLWLYTCIKSVLNQTYTNIELIVIDDCSDIPFSGIRNKINDNRIRWIENKINLGVSATRNKGADLATGEWLSFLDSDDWWLPDKLTNQLSMASTKKTEWMYCSVFLVDSKGKQIRKLIANKEGQPIRELLQEVIITGSASSVLVKKDLFVRIGGFDTSDCIVEDWDLWLRLCLVSKVGFVAEPLVNIRTFVSSSRSSNNTSAKMKRLDGFFSKHHELYKQFGLTRYFESHKLFVTSKLKLVEKKYFTAIFYLLKSVLLSPKQYKIKRMLGWLKSLNYF